MPIPKVMVQPQVLNRRKNANERTAKTVPARAGTAPTFLKRISSESFCVTFLIAHKTFYTK